MHKFILIAGFALVSVAAHAGDRGLSMGGGEATKVSAPARADGPRTAEAPQAAEAPRYIERPAAVEPKAETTRSETTRSESMRSETNRASADSAARMRQRPSAMQQRYAGRPQGAAAGGASARRAAMMQQRQAGAHRARYGIKARIISALHRHGIYW
jgi:hypothetical protein